MRLETECSNPCRVPGRAGLPSSAEARPGHAGCVALLARLTGRSVKLGRFTVLLSVLLACGLETARADWPAFRGPWGDGQATGPGDTAVLGLPLNWSETENVKWKTEIPYRGWSTPVVLGGQVWLTTATPEGRDFFAICVDSETGEVRFNEKLFHSEKPEPLGNSVNSYATPSPAIEPGRVYVHFGSYGTAALDTSDFKVLWKRQDLPCRHYRGPASSLVLFENLLILTLDGVDVQDLAALDKKSGETVWKTARSVAWNDENIDEQMAREGDRRKAHSTPLIVRTPGGLQMLSVGAKAAYAYDPRTGRELWRVRYDAWSAAPVPVYDQGLAFIISGFGGKTELLAVRADGQGDITDTQVAWRTDSMVSKTASPILVEGLLYMVNDEGLLTCLEAATGKQVWRGRIPGHYAASPIYADGRLYFCNQQGTTTVIKPGRSLEPLATNTLAGGFMASPAVARNSLFLRTKTGLYRIQAAASQGK
ncbi:MAG: PQQ-binding-like beta-propeller repeat protein [Verrucomicrobiota bacterium]